MINEKAITKAVKELAKSDRLFTERVGDIVYICNAYCAVYLHNVLYSELVRPVSALFLDLEDGEGTRKDFNDKLSAKTDSPMRVSEIIRNAKSDISVSDTEFKKIIKGKKCANVLLANDKMIMIDERLLEMCRAFNDSGVLSESTDSKHIGNAPVVSVSDKNIGYMVLPLRRDSDFYRVTIA